MTHYLKDDAGGSLTAHVQCAEHTESSVHGDVGGGHALYDSPRPAMRLSDHLGTQSL
ncbi:hypothetical protein ACS5PJ_17395 [Pseudarthrobacter sp. YS3]|uniref:hypothetical protein n=1 Tax=Pseudarthrobacter sp. YS3 TaxID=3453718 RepID=UPI003EECDDAB